jgi:hypothetical protein
VPRWAAAALGAFRTAVSKSAPVSLDTVSTTMTAAKEIVNDELKEEWEQYLEQTEKHVEILREVFSTLGC